MAGRDGRKAGRLAAIVAMLALALCIAPAAALADGGQDGAPGQLVAAQSSDVALRTMSGGSGTQTDPYLVNDATELCEAIDKSTGIENTVYVKLNKDITLASPTEGHHIKLSSKSVDLDLNGKSITDNATSQPAHFNVFEVGGESGRVQLTLRGSGEINCTHGLAFVGSNGSFTMEGGTINCKRGVKANGSAFTMNGGTINATGSGNFDFGVQVVDNGSFTMNGGTIKTDYDTKGVDIHGGSTFTMEGGAIKAEGKGAFGVNVDKGTITMNGGTISSKYNYGVDLCALNGGGSFTMHGGTVSSENLVGVYICDGDSFEMDGGTVSSEGNWSVRVVEGSFTMNGGTVSSGVSVGVYVDSSGSFTMRGGKVSSEGNYEYGVCVDPGGSFTIDRGTVAGGKQSVYGYVKNTMTGVGWTDFGGTQGRTKIAASTEAREYPSYKKIAFPLDDVTVSVSSAGNGTVSSGGTYAYGETVTMKATADAGYHFASWTEGGTVVSTDASYTFDVMSNRTLVAHFKKKVYTVTWKQDDGAVIDKTTIEHGKVPTHADPTRAADSQFTYRFKGWTPAAKAALGDATYTATYEAIPVEAKPVPASTGNRTPMPKMTARGRTALSVAWAQVDGAQGYDIFFSRYNHDGKKETPGKVATIGADGSLSWDKDGLKPGASYKARVKAYALVDGKKRYISTSPLMHLYTEGGKYTNAKAVKLNRKKVTLKKGRTFQLRATVKKVNGKKKLMPESHVARVRYLSTDRKVATVTPGGKVKARGKGTCYVYAYAHNGVSKRVKVTVK